MALSVVERRDLKFGSSVEGLDLKHMNCQIHLEMRDKGLEKNDLFYPSCEGLHEDQLNIVEADWVKLVACGKSSFFKNKIQYGGCINQLDMKIDMDQLGGHRSRMSW